MDAFCALGVPILFCDSYTLPTNPETHLRGCIPRFWSSKLILWLMRFIELNWLITEAVACSRWQGQAVRRRRPRRCFSFCLFMRITAIRVTDADPMGEALAALATITVFVGMVREDRD